MDFLTLFWQLNLPAEAVSVVQMGGAVDVLAVI